MTIICGQDGTSFASPVAELEQFSNGGAQGFNVGYPALFSGTVTSANVKCATGGVGGTASQFQVCVYAGGSLNAGGGTLLATSNTGAVVAGNLVNVTFPTPFALTHSSQYTIIASTPSGFLATFSDSGTSAFVLSQYTSTLFPFATPPGALPTRSNGTGREFIIWLDGSAGVSVNWVGA